MRPAAAEPSELAALCFFNRDFFAEASQIFAAASIRLPPSPGAPVPGSALVLAVLLVVYSGRRDGTCSAGLLRRLRAALA
jgi:hypothetical protein